jgi:hypothetical protein
MQEMSLSVQKREKLPLHHITICTIVCVFLQPVDMEQAALLLFLPLVVIGRIVLVETQQNSRYWHKSIRQVSNNKFTNVRKIS